MRASIPRPHRVEFVHSDTAVYGPEDVYGIVRSATMTRWRISMLENGDAVTGRDYVNSMLVPITIHLNLKR